MSGYTYSQETIDKLDATIAELWAEVERLSKAASPNTPDVDSHVIVGESLKQAIVRIAADRDALRARVGELESLERDLEVARLMNPVPKDHIRDDQQVDRRVLGTFVYTVEGDVVADGARVYFPNERGNICEWDVSGAGDHIPVDRFWSTSEAAEGAKEAGNG